ncbi:LysM domain-containing protein [Aquimarina sp. I32.4]|uniref:LysM peptidoglycan-binding domain-containing protein n=1 Tax=Aquimarina sp. I32.4 TaxID=2053903 RepID=UPI000CDE6DF7|nr:LysM domain-containing protein [Aquimarina sp. I32.4]
MKTIYRTYKIKNRDTLASIAKDNDVDVNELIQYHNKRSEIYEHIQDRLPSFLQEIVLPPKGYSLINGKEVWLNKEVPEPDTLKKSFYGGLRLEFPENDLNYGVLKTIKSGKKENTIKYKLSLRFYPENEALDHNFISIDLVSKIFINDEEPNLIADELAVACTEVLYPLVVKTDNNLNLLDIVNHQDIVKRWKKQKRKKLSYYQGSVAEKYFHLFEQTLFTKDLFFEHLQNDWFFKAYFNKIYTGYNDKLEVDNKIEFPILPNTKNIQYTVSKKGSIFIKDNRIKIEIDGKCTDPRNKIELEKKAYFPTSIDRNHTPVKGKYRALYFLNSKDHRIQSIYLSCDLDMSKTKSGTITISELDNDSQIQHKRHPKSIKFQEENNTDKKKKTFWKSLFS